MKRSVKVAALAVFGLAPGFISLPAVAAEPVLVLPLPEAEYQLAHQDAVVQYQAGLVSCGFVNWSSRDDCDRLVIEQYQRAELEARQRYLRAQADISKLVRNPDGSLRTLDAPNGPAQGPNGAVAVAAPGTPGM